MFIHALPLVHAALAAIALLLGTRLLQLNITPSSHSEPTVVHFNTTLPPQPTAIFADRLVAYNFNIPQGNSTLLHGQQVQLKRPIATPFLLAGIELATIAFVYGVKSLFTSAKSFQPADTSYNKSFLLFSPLLALCSTAQFAIWSPSVQLRTSDNATISLFLLLKVICLVAASKISIIQKNVFSRTSALAWLTTAVALVSGIALNPLAFSYMASYGNGGVVTYGVLLSCALISPIGSWVLKTAASSSGSHPFLMSVQCLAASLFSMFASFTIERIDSSAESIQLLMVFSAISIISSGSWILFPSSSPIIAVELLRDQLSLVMSITAFGFFDSSSLSVRISFLVLVTGLIFVPKISWPLPGSGYLLIQGTQLPPLKSDSDHTDTVHKPNLFSYVLIGLASFLCMGVGFFYVNKSNSPLPMLRGNVQSLENIKHQHWTIPADNEVKRIVTVSLDADSSLTSFDVSKTKSAKPFAIKAIKSRSSSMKFERFEARIPSVQHLPRREWDPKDEKELPSHVHDLTYDHIQIGIFGAPKDTSHAAFSARTFGMDPKIQWTLFWPGNVEPNGNVGEHSFLLESIKKLTGRFPVVFRSHWKEGTAFVKMLPYLYQRSPESTRWFFLSGDDTIIFPKQLLNVIKQIPGDPMTKSMYVGEVADVVSKANLYGWDMASGAGGFLISRHLAKRVNDRYKQCLEKAPEFNGDGILRTCVVSITKEDGLGAVGLTRVSAFNSGDIFKYYKESARKLVSAKLSRVSPATIYPASEMPSLMVGMDNAHSASFDFWQLVNQIPLNVRFRRFFIHFQDGRTAVVTFGLHVRMYRYGLKTLEHTVDWDGEINWSSDYVGQTFLLDGEYLTWVRKDIYDYWLLHYDSENNTLVFSDDAHWHQFHLKCRVGSNSVLNLCSESQ